jgi:hypothetical protein
MQPIVECLSQEEIPVGCLRQLHEATTIPIGTFKSWRCGLRSDPPRIPYEQPSNISKRALTPAQEEALAHRIRADFIDQKKFCPLQMVQRMAMQIHRESYEIGGADRLGIQQRSRDLNDIIVQRNDEEFVLFGAKKRPPFKASRRWRGTFMKRNGLSKRKPHTKRRPSLNPDDIQRHREQMRNVLSQFPPDRVINMDETSWKLLNHGFVTVANTGSETVECLFAGDPTMCLTAIAAIDAVGGKLPIWILARGTTPRCERRYRTDEALSRAIAQGHLVVSHQQNGWTDAQVAGDYLRWLRTRFASGEIVLVWDVFISHRCQETKELAAQLGIRLEFIPPGATADCQPLDRRLFGNLKSRARARFDEIWAVDHEPSMEESIAMLLDAWKSISQFEVLDAFEAATH